MQSPLRVICSVAPRRTAGLRRTARRAVPPNAADSLLWRFHSLPAPAKFPAVVPGSLTKSIWLQYLITKTARFSLPAGGFLLTLLRRVSACGRAGFDDERDGERATRGAGGFHRFLDEKRGRLDLVLGHFE